MTSSVAYRGGSVAGGALLVAGTCIGGGMLALPVATAQAGSLPALVLFALCCLLNLASALLIVEVTLWAGAETNLVSMARATLGRVGSAACWALYLFLFYSLCVAYVSGGGDLLTDATDNVVPEWIGSLLYVGIFAPCVYLGARVVDRMNSLLMLGLGLSFALFFVLGLGHVHSENLMHRDWQASLWALPVLFVSFAFQGLVPTLCTYLDRDPVRIRRSLILGSILPLLAYCTWELLILGIVPADAMLNQKNALAPLKAALSSPGVVLIGAFFAFFAITTSMLGVALALLDFLADGLNVEKTPAGRVGLLALIFIPPIVASWTTPGLFLSALGYAGGFGTALLLNFMPMLMAWRVRRQTRLRLLPGGKLLIIVLLVLILGEVGIQLLSLLGS